MPELDDVLKKRVTGEPSVEGLIVRGTDVVNAPLYEAPCWAWALAGKAVSSHDKYAVDTIYSNIYTFKDYTEVSGLNTEYIDQLKNDNPGIESYCNDMTSNIDNAILNVNECSDDKDKQVAILNAQDACSLAVMKIISTIYGFELSDSKSNYKITMKRSSWNSADHWGISYSTAEDKKIYIQTHPNKPVKYLCSCLWGGGVESCLYVSGFLPTQIAVLENGIY